MHPFSVCPGMRIYLKFLLVQATHFPDIRILTLRSSKREKPWPRSKIWFCLAKIQIWFCLRSKSKAKSSFFFGLPTTIDKPLPSIVIEVNFFINRWIYILTPSKPVCSTRRFPRFVAVASPPLSSFQKNFYWFLAHLLPHCQFVIFFVYCLSMRRRRCRHWAKVHYLTMAGGFHPQGTSTGF